MSSIKQNTTGKSLKAKKGAKIAIIQAQYNAEISDKLLESCREELMLSGVLQKNISMTKAPGAFELPIACQRVAKAEKPDAVIALGVIIRGGTPHFEYVASGATIGIMNASLSLNLPIIFGILTTDNLSQAKARVKGGKEGDKGVEAAQAAIRMINNLPE
jgi:6,7-dimethyl-8-ribityllumazine synthase